MTRYTPVESPRKGGIYWYELDNQFSEHPKILVRVMDLHPGTNRAEIVFVAGDSTCIWVKQDKLMDREEWP